MNTINNFTGKYAFLSNFHPSPNTPPTLEHWYQAAKTDDLFASDAILKAATPAQAKRMGRRVSICEGFEEHKLDVMLALVRAKFTSPELEAQLLATGEAELIEGNYWHDNYWGACWCLKCTDKPKLNNLGKILMQVRKERECNRKI